MHRPGNISWCHTIIYTYFFAYERSAAAVLSAVRTAMSRHAATKVTVVGHSLGTIYPKIHTNHSILFDIQEVHLRSLHQYICPCISLLELLSGLSHTECRGCVTHRGDELNDTCWMILKQVGNQAFADYVDGHVDLTHINNQYVCVSHFWSSAFYWR